MSDNKKNGFHEMAHDVDKGVRWLAQNAYIRVGTGAVIIMSVLGTAVGVTASTVSWYNDWSTWRDKHDERVEKLLLRTSDLPELRTKLKEVDESLVGNRGNRGWHREHMINWCRITQLENQDPSQPWRCGHIDPVRQDGAR